MSALLPKLRSGLTVSHQGTAAVVMDPVRREFFRLGEVECFLVERCDGATAVADALQAVERRFDAVMPRDALERFIASLDGAGLLEREGAPAPEPPRRRVRGNLFYLRYPLFDPDVLLGRLVKPFEFCYRPTCVAVCAALIFVASLVAVTGWRDVAHDAGRLYRWSAVPEIWLTVWSVVLLHELAHGLTCKRFGGEVHELGLLLLYFQPAAYCNVSSAWLFPEKRKRVLVTLAGPWLELSLWALATFTWRVTDTSSWVNELALIVVATSGIKSFLNLNPFLKLDGYYLLSDLLGIPNLRRRGFKLMGDALRALFGKAPRLVAPATREGRILIAYGAVATVLTVGFIGYAVVKLGRYATQDRMLPFVIFLGLVSIKLPRKLKRIFSGRDDDSFDDDDEPDVAATAAPANGVALVPQPAASPAPVNGAATVAAPASATAPVARAWTSRRATWVAAAVFAVALLGVVPVDLKVRGPFRTLPHQNADVRALVDGIVAEVAMEEGQAVRAGDVLARLSSVDLDAQAGVLDARIEQARAQLRLLLDGPRPEDVKVAAAALETAAGHLPYARDRLAMNRTLCEGGIISRQELQLSEEQAVTAQHEVDEARERLRAVSTGARPDDIDAARANLNALVVERQALEDRRGKLVLRSPCAGVVATPALELHDLLHRHVGPGDLVAKVYDDRAMTAEIGVSEQDIADVHVGQPVMLRARAQPGVTFHGTVQALGVAALPASGGTGAGSADAPAVAARSVLVRTSIDNRDLLLRPEMTGQAKIVCGRQNGFGLAARAIARTFKVEFWAWS
jgi:multidrug resistance efflux pump